MLETVRKHHSEIKRLEKRCQLCGLPLSGRRPNSIKYHPNCRKNAYYRRHRERINRARRLRAREKLMNL